MTSLFITGVLPEDDIQEIEQETTYIFEDRSTFIPGAVQKLGYVDPSVRSVLGRGLRGNPYRIPNTTNIAMFLLFDLMGKTLNCFHPDPQLLIYRPGDFFIRHRDHIQSDVDGVTIDGDMHRVMSLSINLNEDYEGGELQIETESGIVTAPPVRGGYALFSGLHYHQVTPVTKHERRAITYWFLGGIEEFKKMRTMFTQGGHR